MQSQDSGLFSRRLPWRKRCFAYGTPRGQRAEEVGPDCRCTRLAPEDRRGAPALAFIPVQVRACVETRGLLIYRLGRTEVSAPTKRNSLPARPPSSPLDSPILDRHSAKLRQLSCHRILLVMFRNKTIRQSFTI